MSVDAEGMPKKIKNETAADDVEAALYTDISEQANAVGIKPQVFMSPKLLLALVSAPEDLKAAGETEFVRLSRMFLGLMRHLNQHPKASDFDLSVLLPTKDAMFCTITCHVDKNKVRLREAGEDVGREVGMKREVAEAAKHLLPGRIWRDRNSLAL